MPSDVRLAKAFWSVGRVDTLTVRVNLPLVFQIHEHAGNGTALILYRT